MNYYFIKEKGFNVGLSGSVSFNNKDKNGKTKTSKTAEASYDAVDRKQINRATIGAGTIIVDGKEENPNINRDETKIQEITKDVSVSKIKVNYSDEKREWYEVPNIMGEYGEKLGGDLDKLSTNKYELKDKMSSGLNDLTFEVEKVLDHDLKNNIIGLIPTSEYTGGILGQLQKPKKRYYDGDQELVYAEIKVAMDENGKPLVDRKGRLLIDSKTKNIETNNKIEKDVRIKPVSANGVFNSRKDAIAGSAAATFTPEEDAALRRGETIKMGCILTGVGGLIL